MHRSNISWNGIKTSTKIIGKTTEGRSIYVFTVTQMQPDRRRALILSGVHGREWISISSVLYFIEILFSCLKLSTKSLTCSKMFDLLDKVDLHIVPVLNPDGYAYTWQLTDENQMENVRLRLKKGSHTGLSRPRPAPVSRFWRGNRKKLRKNENFENRLTYGVDLNRNWGTFGINWGFGVKQLKSKNFQGFKGFSEAETQAIKKYVRELGQLNFFLDIHCCSRNVIAPFSLVPYDDVMADQLALKGVLISKAMQLQRTKNLNKLLVSDLKEAKKKVFTSMLKKPYYYKRRPKKRGKFSSGLSTGWAFSELKLINSFTIELGAKFITPHGLMKPIAMELVQGILQIESFFELNDTSQRMNESFNTGLQLIGLRLTRGLCIWLLVTSMLILTFGGVIKNMPKLQKYNVFVWLLVVMMLQLNLVFN